MVNFTPCLIFQCIFYNFQCIITLLRTLSVALSSRTPKESESATFTPLKGVGVSVNPNFKFWRFCFLPLGEGTSG